MRDQQIQTNLGPMIFFLVFIWYLTTVTVYGTMELALNNAILGNCLGLFS